MSRWRVFRDGVLTFPGGGETIRAFAIFAMLFTALGWATHRVAFADMSRIAANYRMSRAREEAGRIAAAVVALGRGPAGIDFYKIKRHPQDLEGVLAEHLDSRPELLFVDVRDRFDISVSSLRTSQPPHAAPAVVAKVPLLVGGIPQGEVRVGISSESFSDDVAAIQRALRIKVALFASAGVGLLILALVYVGYLIRKNRALEQDRQSAARVAYRGLLASGLAHEIRNPLNAMNMNLQMLEEELHGMPGAAEGDQLELLAATKSEIKRLERLVNNFLLYARPSAPKYEPQDLNEVLRATALFLQADFRQHGVELAVDLEPLLPSVELDEAQFRQAIMNILVNARQVMPRGGVVRLVSHPGSAGDVVVEVQDQGPGIPPENRDRIFEPFFSKRAGGTGLGLAIARQMIEGHGGRIDVDSEVGKGTTFRIRLPRRHRAVAEAANGQASR